MFLNFVKLNGIVTELERALGNVAQKVPKGFRTKDEWAKIWECHPTSAWNLCRSHVQSGKMLAEKFRIKTEFQSNRPVVHYKAKQ